MPKGYNMKKIIMTLLISMFVLTSCANTEKKIAQLPQEYQDLQSRCDMIVALGMNPDNYAMMKNARECCMKSIIKMSEGNYKAAEAANPDGTGPDVCPEGFEINRMECEGSYRWCELAG
jgi:hypothetical protein